MEKKESSEEIFSYNKRLIEELSKENDIYFDENGNITLFKRERKNEQEKKNE